MDSCSVQMHPGVWKIDEDGNPAQLADQQAISRAVPGDILVLGGWHVVIIQNIRYAEGSTMIASYDQVDVIHATDGGLSSPEQWRVQRDTWNKVANNYKLYQLRRYK